MFNRLIMWALVCSATPFICARETPSFLSVCPDTAECASLPQLLDEIVVTATPVLNMADRKIIRPDKETLATVSGGIDLLRKLDLHGVAVNPLTGEVTVSGGGTLIFCIDGVEVSPAQIAAIHPADVLRIEYHDNPGVRYDGAAVVIDYIMARHATAGSVMLDAFGAFAPGRYATIDHFAAQYQRGRSAWSVNIGFMGQRKNRWIRDYDETWHYPDATVSRHERGLPVKVGNSGMESVVHYNYLHPRGDMLDIRLGIDTHDIPNQEEGDRRALLETSVSELSVEVSERTEEHSTRPHVGVYYRRYLSAGASLTLDCGGSYISSRMLHTYAEDGEGEESRVEGHKYSMQFLALYENRSGNRVWNIGLSGNSSFIHNVYGPARPVTVDLNQCAVAVVGSYSDRVGPCGAMLNLKAAYRHMGQAARRIDKFFLLPSVTLSFRPSDQSFLRYVASLDYVMPAASQLSEVAQPVQAGMIRRGNPALKPFPVIVQSFSASLERTLASVEATLEYRCERTPIMESVIYEDGGFVRVYLNQRSFRSLRSGISLTVRPWKNHLSISAEPMLTRYFSHGIDYSHCHNIFRIGWSADFSYGHWQAYATVMSGPANIMYGEEIIEEKDMNQIMVGYKENSWSVHLGVLNAFVRNYRMETRNLSALAPYISNAHSGGRSPYIAVKLNLSLDFGAKERRVEVHESVQDTDLGILSGTK